ncbi:MAG: sulfite exporter TauE/SafE family protein, partial [Candidatus Binatia bacterium]|nr:sulfite exporter TauE/SafE family protein [Candidatus Binatia bacterium]
DWEVAKPLLVGMIIGVAAGTWLFIILAADWLTLIMGLLVTWIVLMDRLRLLERLGRWTDLRSRTVTSLLSVTSSTVGTVSGGGIFFLVIYLKLACKTPVTLRGTNLVLSGTFLAFRALFIAIAGLVSQHLLVEAALLVPIVFLGTWTGTRFFQTSSAERFYAGLQLLLLCAAFALIGKGIAQLL